MIGRRSPNNPASLRYRLVRRATFLLAMGLCFRPIPGKADVFYYRDTLGRVVISSKPFPGRAGSAGRKRTVSLRRVRQEIRRCARKYGIDEALLQALIQAESDFDPFAESRAGAKGFMQLMPETARDLKVTDVFDPKENIDAGARYFRALFDRFGLVEQALAAYNAGPEAVVKYGGLPPYRETRRFVRRVLRYYARIKGAAKKKKGRGKAFRDPSK